MAAGELDALPPPAMAHRAEEVGVSKVALSFGQTLWLAILAGAFIAFGAVFATTVTADPDLGFGASRFVGGLAFSLGLVLVVVGGAELFTGNNLIVMAWARRSVSTWALARNWSLVYVGNLIGSVTIAALVVVSGHHQLGGGAVGDQAIAIAEAKLDHTWVEAFALGVLANMLVCLAVWLTMSARSLVDRVVAVILPITAFVAAGFEHSIANMYFVPSALLLDAHDDAGYWELAAPDAPGDADLSWWSFLTDNLIPVTLGNIVGGAAMVALVYWFVYLRDPRSRPQDALPDA